MLDTAPAYRYVQERLGVDVKTAAAATELASLGVDSLALLEMVFEIEERFGVKVDEDTPPPRSCGELVALIERLAATKP
ncbi:MAG: acyl carrier protein [Betaproteobacteria bacterium]|nr:acyl carrier protein [Betaproteobacteria bacterium]MDH4323422.1 acyl carrier protein [Betaproteobacteria bacterium]